MSPAVRRSLLVVTVLARSQSAGEAYPPERVLANGKIAYEPAPVIR